MRLSALRLSAALSLATLFAGVGATAQDTAPAASAQGRQANPPAQTSAPSNAQQARGRRGNEPGTAGADADATPAGGLPIPPESKAVTDHTWSAGGRTVHYQATAGNLLIRDEQDKPNGSIFYVAYTEVGATVKNRPVTFLYNGGPGSATIWLHMGSVGPIRVVTASPAASGPPPYEWVDNQYSLIDKTDLVFIDAPMTGFSRAVGKGSAKDFAGVDEDIRAFEKFITRYITVNGRWNSPKYLFGESYGTPRSAALVAALNNDGIAFNGVVLLSSILNYYARSPGYDIDPITYFPSYCAIGWYHNKVKHSGRMEDHVQKCREFAQGPYSEALHQGDMLPRARFDEIAQQITTLTGLPLEYVKQSKLRISATRYRKELMRPEGKILGRYDARFEGDDTEAAGENPGYDPSDTGISGPYVGAFHEYIRTELKYMSEEPYYLSGPGLNGNWDWHHRPSGGGGGGGRGGQDQPNTVVDLSDAMRKNPKLRVFSANGWYDLATPFFGTEHDLAQMMLPDSEKGNVSFGYYPAGHMVYLNVDALKSMHADLDRWYAAGAR